MSSYNICLCGKIRKNIYLIPPLILSYQIHKFQLFILSQICKFCFHTFFVASHDNVHMNSGMNEILCDFVKMHENYFYLEM